MATSDRQKPSERGGGVRPRTPPSTVPSSVSQSPLPPRSSGRSKTEDGNSQRPPQDDLTNDKLILAAPRMRYEGRTVPSLGGIPLLTRIGRGGMGAVYFGIHPRLLQEVAVKVLPFHLADQQPDLIHRFYREAQAAARVQSPHLVRVMDVNEENGLYFLVMEYVAGISAGIYLDLLKHQGQQGLPESEALDVCIATTKGLAAAHREGIIHRDIKPDNIIIPQDKRSGDLLFSEAKLADLGLARTDEPGESLTQSAASMGTPGYMAPEQGMSARRAGKPADVFSMGATFYSLVAGRSPFPGDSGMEIFLNTLQHPHLSLPEVRPDITPATAALIDRCLAKDPSQRPVDGTALLALLDSSRAALTAIEAEAARRTKKQYDAAIAQGREQLKLGDFDGAEAAFKDAMTAPGYADDPKAQMAILEVGAVLEQHRKAQAERRVRQQYEAAMSRAEERLRTGDLDGAAVEFNAALKMPSHHDDKRAQDGLARVQAARDAALFAAMMDAGQEALTAKQWDAAEAHFRRALKHQGNSDAAQQGINRARAEIKRAAEVKAEAVIRARARAKRSEEAEAQYKAEEEARREAESEDETRRKAQEERKRQEEEARSKNEIKVNITGPGESEDGSSDVRGNPSQAPQCLETTSPLETSMAQVELPESPTEVSPLRHRNFIQSTEWVANPNERRDSEATRAPRPRASYRMVAAGLVVVAILLASTISALREKTSPKRPDAGIQPEVYQAWPFDGAEAKRRQKETADRLGTTVETALDLGNGVKLELLLIPAGKFIMGSPETEKERGNNEEQHEVTLTKAYWMGKYEVTQEEYERVMGANPASFKGARNPVESVSWIDAQEFCRKLSQRTGREVRLATEAEWEHACRGGTQTRYSFGDEDGELHRFGNYCEKSNSDGNPWQDKEHDDGQDKTAPAGSYKPNGFGLYDMHGNVWEWCGDGYGEYGQGAQRDPTGAADAVARVLRGGSWFNLPWFCRSANRDGSAPDYRYVIVGFRVVVVARTP